MKDTLNEEMLKKVNEEIEKQWAADKELIDKLILISFEAKRCAEMALRVAKELQERNRYHEFKFESENKFAN